MPNTFADDAMGMSFIHNLWISNDCNFIKLILVIHRDDPVNFRKLTGIQDMNIEMNKLNKMSHLTPITAILINEKYDMIKVIFEHIISERTIKIDISPKDSRGRNVLHCLMYNKNISNEERLDVFLNYIFRLDSSVMFSAHVSSLKPLYSQIDKDGFLPVTVYVSRIKSDQQDDDVHKRMFELLSENTDYDAVLSDIKQENFQHPLVMCIKSKLEKYFKRFLDSSITLRKQMIFVEKSSRRTTIEYAFDSDMECFIKPILDALDRIDSFILFKHEKEWVTLFDTLFSVVQSARNRHIFALEKDDVKPKHPTAEWIDKLAHTMFNETKDSTNKRAEDFLSNFNYTPEQDDSDLGISKPKIMKKMPPVIKKRIMDEYNAKVEAAKKAKADTIPVVLKSTKSLLDKSFDMNDHFSYPYLFKFCKDKTVMSSTVDKCLSERKHIVIFQTVYDWVVAHPDASEEYGDEFDMSRLILDNYYEFNTLIPQVDNKQYMNELHQLCLQYWSTEIKHLKNYKLIQEFDKNCGSLQKQIKTELLNLFFRTCHESTGSDFCMVIELILDTMNKNKLLLDFNANPESIMIVKESFKKLLMERDFAYVLVLQKMIQPSIKDFYQKKIELMEKNTNNEGEKDDESNYAETLLCERDVNEWLFRLLQQLTSFEQYNQINFYDGQDLIIQILKGFIKLGAFSYINIGFSKPEDFNEHDKRVEVQRLMQMIDEFKESRQKHSDYYCFLNFLATFNDYNDISSELIENNTPLVWTIASQNSNMQNMFEFAIAKDNLEFAMKLIDCCDITKVLSAFPLQRKTIEKLVNSRHITKFLEFVSKNEEKIKLLIMENKDSASILRSELQYENVERHIKSQKNPQELGSDADEDYFEKENCSIIFYAFYQRNYSIPKLGKEIPYFNILFMYQDRYVLDELVKILSVKEIKQLNEQGYVIGMMVTYYDKSFKDRFVKSTK
jgi:hypothetical protein